MRFIYTQFYFSFNIPTFHTQFISWLIYHVNINQQVNLQIKIFQSGQIMSHKKISGYIIHLKQILGKGSYGQVYRGEHEQTKNSCAVKIINKKTINSDDYLKAALMEEIQILQQVKSQNIVTVYQVMESSNNYYIIQELCDNDLQRLIRDYSPLPEEQAIDILRQMANGFLALMKEGIIHRDVKPANILISKGVIKIGDFGFAKRNVSRKMKTQTSVGTPLYMSPQVLKGMAYTSKCDVWAVGIIFFEMLHRRTPWTAKSVYQLVKKIQAIPVTVDHRLSPATKDYIKNSLGVEEGNRYSWQEVFRHGIFKGFFNNYLQNNKVIENKLKSIMGRLRFKITSENIDVRKLLSILGLQHEKQELNFSEFKTFLDYIYPSLPEEQIRYFFDKVDEDSSGTISVEEIQKQMNRHRITTDRGGSSSSRLKKANTLNEDLNEVKMSNTLTEKAKKCFQRLYRVLSYKKISLRKTFQAYDKEGMGNLSFECFKNMLGRLDPSFSQEDIHIIFDFIDTDHSKTIEFEELNEYYCKVNGLPNNFDEAETPMMRNRMTI